MRLRRASASNGIVDRRVRLSHQTFILAGMAVVGLWMAGSLVQELSLNQSLSHQATDVRDQNAALRQTNAEYQRDIASESSGAAGEEEARRDRDAPRDRKPYPLGKPPPPPPALPRPP